MIKAFKKTWWIFLHLFLIGILSSASAVTKTIDADGTADYNSLDAVLTAIQGGLDPDTINFIGSNQHTYTWNYYVDKNIGTVVFTSTQTDPDKFPIINITNKQTYNFFVVNNISFEKICITGSTGFNLAQGGKSFSFKKCVFRDFPDSVSYAVHFEGLAGTVLFENCIFSNNLCKNVFDFNIWGGSPTFTITNCTFDNNKSIWDEDENNNANFSLKNCIFSNNDTTFRGNNLRSKTTYSMTSESISGYSTGCFQSSATGYISTAPTKPSDYYILFSSAARDKGTTGGPNTDIAGVTRYAPYDIGAYENFNNPPTNIILSDTSVYENLSSGTTVGTFKTVDPDTIRYDTVFTYSLESGVSDNSSFIITGKTLKTNTSFNYENQKIYNIKVRTTDQAGKYLTKSFTIVIKDTNEAPTDISISTGTVPENSATGTLVGKFTSVDPDTDTVFTYSFAPGNSDSVYFKIRGDSLFTNSVFNFETPKNTFSVKLRSMDQSGLYFEKVLTISVTNVNESPDTVFLFSKDSVPENSPNKTFVSKLTTQDPDTGNTFTYSLVAGLDAASFSISHDTLYTAAVFNYEVKNTYTIRIQSVDQGGLSDVSQFTIKVRNVSEAPTKISLSSNTINENLSVGTTIGTLSSVDEDIGETFSYSLSGADASSFTVTGSTLKSNSVFNYEKKKNYTIIIRSTDKGGSFKDSTFNISIMDVNDTSTGITLSKDSVPDNTKGIIVGELKAVDEDTLETFTYSLVGGTDNINFSISGNQLKADSLMDYQFKPVYNIKVRAIGSFAGSPIDTVSQAFSIKVFGPPEISYSSDDTTVQEGKKAVFSVTASGHPTLSYRWYKVGNLTSIDTSTTHTFSGSRFSDSGRYYCEISNPYGTIRSDTAKLTVVPAPASIALQPLSHTVNDFDTVSFSVTASGTLPIKYLWLKNGIDSVGDSSTLKFQVHYANSGSNYKCIVTNVAGKDTSDSVSLTVKAISPKISKILGDTNHIEGDTAVFIVQVKGTAPLKYNWYKNNATSDTLSSTDTLIKIIGSKSDSGEYHCTVSNGTGSDTKYVKITVGPKAPSFSQPVNDTVVEGDTGKFFTNATGSKPLQFSWFKKDRPDTVFGRNDTLTFAKVTGKDSGQYYCIIQNPADTDTTKYARLIVLTQPRIEQQPIKKSIYFEHDTLKLEIIANGNPSPKYQWFKNGDIISGAVGSVLIIDNLTYENNNDNIYCSVYNSIDTIKSKIVKITMEHAGFTASPSIGKIPLTVTFTDTSITDTSIGKNYSRIWDFGDGKIDTTEAKTITHAYSNSGSYNVKLTVFVSGRSDFVKIDSCIWAYKPGDNPIQITASYIKGTSIKIQLSNFKDINISFPPPYVDSVGVWGTAGKLPQDSSVKPLKVYNKSQLSTSTAILIDTLNLPAGSDSVNGIYGLMTGLFWNDNRISNFSTPNPNGCIVLLRDTFPPQNPLEITGTYNSGTDSVLFTISNIDKIDTSKADSIVVWYGQDITKYGNDTKSAFSVQEIKSKASRQIFTFYVQNQLFLDSAKLSCSVAIVGKNHLYSNKYSSQFSVGNPSPDNPVVLNAMVISPSKVRLTWNKLTNIGNLRIWKGLQPIPEKDISYRKFDTLKVSINDTTILLTGLNPQTSYYFGAQVQVIKNGPWSKVTVKAGASVTTPPPSDTTKIPNTIVLDNPVFDTLAGKIRLHWCLDTAIAEDMIVGITYSYDRYPDLPLETFNVQVTNECTDTVLELRDGLLFDTTYYIALWVRKADGVWASPTDKSCKTIRTPKFTREVISFFNQNAQDTVKAFNNTISLWKDPNYNYASTQDTIVAYTPDSLPDGLIQIGSGFEFSKKEPTAAFYIGMKYDSIPAGLRSGAIRMYRDSAGIIMIEYGAVVDSVNKIVYVKTAELDFPFILMIDTLKPVVDFTSNTNSIAFKDSDIKDTLIINDNISNVKWKLVYGKGDTGYIKSISGMLNAYKDTINISIQAATHQINQDCGIRALLIISDDVHSDTFNISRQVMREKSDEVITISDHWYPLSVTAELKNDNPESVLVRINNLARENNKESKLDTIYDMRYARLFRWIPTAENNNSEDKWVEYSGSNSSLFKFVPGRIIWIKTLNNILFDFGSGVTTSLKDTFEIKLPPKNWTDFALPYFFTIRLADILSSTKKADSLHIYSWVKDTSNEYSAKGILIPGIADKQNRNFDISHTNGLTIYNPYNDTVILRIPPVPSSLSKKSLSKKAGNSLWGVKVVCRTNEGTLLPDVYCGFSKDAPASYLPAAPSFMKTRVMVINRENGRNYGHFITGNISKDGFSREISFINNSKNSVHFTFSLAKVGALPGGFSPSVLDPVTQNWQNTGEIVVAPRSVETRIIAIGTDNFRSDLKMKIFSFKYALLSVYPNPCLSFARIRFTVPYNSKEQLDFSLFNFAGKKIWGNRITNPLSAGEHFIIWDGKTSAHCPAGTGLYILRVVVKGSDGRIQKRFASKLTYLR